MTIKFTGVNIQVFMAEDYPREWGLPEYQSEGAACFDLRAMDGWVLGTIATEFRTGLHFILPEGFVMLIFGRSGVGFKHGIRLSNCIGIIDSDYRGEVMIKLHNDTVVAKQISPGDRIAQAMVVPIPRVQFSVVDKLPLDTNRGVGGFGSTGS